VLDKETGIWSLVEMMKRRPCDFLLAAAIATYYKTPATAVDLGCGDGQYCRIFKTYNWPLVHGYEGASQIANLGVYNQVFQVDLSKPLCESTSYEFVLCLEVGEHIPRKHEQVFIENVCKFCKKHLVISWAIPGQGGNGHFNERPNSYIVDEFVKRDFKFNTKLTDKLRRHVSVRWFRNTVMVFYRI